MAHVKVAHPENDVLGNVRGVIGETLQIAAGKHELKIWCDIAGRLPHAFQEALKDFIAVAIDEIVAFQDFAGQDYVFENQPAQALFVTGPAAATMGSSSGGAATAGISAREMIRSARFTAKSPMRSRSLVILRVATTWRISSEDRFPARSMRTACSSITISISLTRGSKRNISLGDCRRSHDVVCRMAAKARSTFISTLRAMETR